MTDKEFVLDTMQRAGLTQAQALQAKAPEMTGTELYQEENYIPDFQAAKAAKNVLERPVGFLCRSSAGRVVKLLQVYDSTVYTQEPEDLPAQWGFYWSTDPEKALPFVSIATSPYMTGNCCTYEGHVWQSGQDGNIWAPGSVGVKWDDLGTIEDVMNGTAGTEPEEPDPVEPEAGPDEWKRPTGAHDAYNTGDRTTYNGKVYESTIDGNTWNPDEYPQGWKLVE